MNTTVSPDDRAALTDLAQIYEAFGIGSQARTMGTLLENIRNSKRRSACLSAIEREFFTIEVPSDEPEDEGVPYEECLLSWGSNPDAYVEQFRDALSTYRSQPQPVNRGVPNKLSVREKASNSNNLVWPEGYCLDPNGKMSCPDGAYPHWSFGYDMGYAEALALRTNVIKDALAQIRSASVPVNRADGDAVPVADTGNVDADRVINRLMSSDPDFDDCTNAAAFIRRLVAEHKGPDGFATWKDAAIHERQMRVAAPPASTSANAQAPVAPPMTLPAGWSIRVTPFQVEVRGPNGKGYAGARDPRTRNGIAGYTLVKLALALHDMIAEPIQTAWPALEPIAAPIAADAQASVAPDMAERIEKAVYDYWGEHSPEGIALRKLIDAAPIASALPAAPIVTDQDLTMNVDELAEFERTVAEFEDASETSTDYDQLMDWARRGLLECTHFEVTKSGNDILAAAPIALALPAQDKGPM